MRGLLGRDGLEPGDGLLITKTGSIHMFFMRFAIDAVFLDKELPRPQDRPGAPPVEDRLEPRRQERRSSLPRARRHGGARGRNADFRGMI